MQHLVNSACHIIILTEVSRKRQSALKTLTTFVTKKRGNSRAEKYSKTERKNFLKKSFVVL